MNNQEKMKEYTEGIKTEGNATVRRTSNFWYHYKWPVVGLLILALILGVCIAQSCSKEKEDIVVMYAGPCALSATQSSSLSNAFSVIMPNDFDKNGDKKASLNTFLIYSREQIEEIEAETDEYGRHATVDRSQNSSEMQRYETYIKTGESSVYLLDPSLYEVLKNDSNQPLQKLEDVLSETPVGALEDGYGIRLGDTKWYEEYEILRVLPEDTVICLARPYVMGKSSKEKAYAFEKEMFASLAGVSVKE